MSPLNRGPLLGPRVPPVGAWAPPPPRFGGRLPPPGMPPRMPPPPMNPVFGPMRQRLPPPRPGGVSRPGGPPPPLFPRGRGISPLVPPMGMRGTGPRGPHMQVWPRRILPPQVLPHMRPRFSLGNGNIKGKPLNNAKKVSKLEELELKKPWMTDEIRSEIQKKNKLYAKAKKNKDAKEWEEFKDLRNKVTRMIRDAKNEYLAKHPEQAALYPADEEPYDQRDENYVSSEDEKSYYCEVCDREFPSEEDLAQHRDTHKLCGIDGCTFSAHPLLVQKHISMQHSTGLYHRLKNVTSPEDIEKWKEERKKRYPTKATVELRKAEELEKKQRGEIIQQRRQLTAESRSKPSLNTRSERRRRNRKRPGYAISNEISIGAKEIYRGLEPFSGTSNLKELDITEEHLNEKEEDAKPSEDVTDNISDEEEIPHIPASVASVVSFIPNLVANYGSDSNEDEGPEEVPVKKVKLSEDAETPEPTVEVKTKRKLNVGQPCDTISRNDQKKNFSKSRTEINQRSQPLKKMYNPNKSHLLYRLLSRSVQHERNLICQCIKYVVDNNFFD